MKMQENGAKERNHLAKQMLKTHFGIEIDTFNRAEIFNLKNLVEFYLNTMDSAQGARSLCASDLRR